MSLRLTRLKAPSAAGFDPCRIILDYDNEVSADSGLEGAWERALALRPETKTQSPVAQSPDRSSFSEGKDYEGALKVTISEYTPARPRE
jgi:hypothetical protein